ncbi:MAG: homoserine dehydrogenase, partial [Chloroflexota bacterium]
MVGAGTLDLLARRSEQIARSIGVEFDVRHVLVRDPSRPRAVAIDRSILTTDGLAVVDDPAVDVVVELIGGESPASDYIERALRNGKHVVTANKEVIAKHGAELLDLANHSNANLFFEASVGGGIPVIGVLRHDLIANEITSLRAIINGTTNFILTAMEQGRDYAEALAEAQQLGYAEADPSNDVDGVD